MMEPVGARFGYDEATGRLSIEGDIEHRDVDELARYLRVCTQAGHVVVDLTSVTFLPAAAVEVIGRAQRRAEGAGTGMDLVAAPGTIAAQVLGVTGFDTPVRGADWS